MDRVVTFSKRGKDIMNRFRLQTSKEYEHFYVKFNSRDGYDKVCDLIDFSKVHDESVDTFKSDVDSSPNQGA